MTLQELRTSRKNSKSQRDIGELIGLTGGRISQIEQDPYNMKLGTMQKLAKEYRVSVRTVFDCANNTMNKGDVK